MGIADDLSPDLVRAEFAARSLETLVRYPAAALCFSDPAKQVGDTGRVEPRPLYLSRGQCFLPPGRLRQLFKRGGPAVPGFVVYRREALVAARGFVEDLYWHADWFTNQVLGFRHGACYVPEVLTVFRVWPGSYHSTGIQQTQVQRELTYRVVDLLRTPAYRDVAPSFRECALLPDLRIRMLVWLFASRRHRRYLTARLAVRVAVGLVWKMVKPYMPGWLRPPVRRLASRWAPVWTAG